jgi:hypothetical protein
MRIEIVLFLIAAAVMGNIYTDGRLMKSLTRYKKYYQMAGVAFAAFAIYYMFKKSPDRAREMVMTSHEYLKYLPVDRNTSSILNPVLDFTSRYGGVASHPILNLGGQSGGVQAYAESRIINSGGSADPVKKATKRSVSETKKKYVAAQQSWKCGNCQKQLPAWFEVDHKIRLEHGGSNHIDNLVALCRDCHGEKTAMENL